MHAGQGCCCLGRIQPSPSGQKGDLFCLHLRRPPQCSHTWPIISSWEIQITIHLLLGQLLWHTVCEIMCQGRPGPAASKFTLNSTTELIHSEELIGVRECCSLPIHCSSDGCTMSQLYCACKPVSWSSLLVPLLPHLCYCVQDSQATVNLLVLHRNTWK